MKVLITGGYGFLGSHIADKFYREGYDLFIIDNLSNGKKENLIHKHIAYQLGVADSKCEEVFKSNHFDVIVHMAAQIDHTFADKFSYKDTEDNILGLVNMLTLAVKYKTKKFIFASDASVYGDNADYICDESSQTNPSSILAVNKLLGEYYCSKWTELYKLETVSLRISNVYGPRQKPQDGVVTSFINSIKTGEGISIQGNGEQLRDFIYVEDVAEAVYAATNIKFSGVLNLSTGRATSINHLVSIIERYGEFKSIQHSDVKETEIRVSVLDNSSIFRIFDWIPVNSIEEGIDKTFNNYNSTILKSDKKILKKSKKRKESLFANFFDSKSEKKKWVPYLENIIAFSSIMLFSLYNLKMYIDFPVDLYLLLIIVFSIVYGSRQGIVASVFSIVSTVFSLIFSGRDPMMLVYSTDLYITFAYYVFISFIIGYIKDNLVRNNDDKSETILILNSKIEFLTNLYHDMRTVRDELQSQIKNSEDSLGKIITIIQDLDTLRPDEVFAKAITVLEKLMKTQGVAIYRFNDTAKYARMMSCSQEMRDSISKSVKIEDSREIINTIINKNLYVSRELEEGKPLLAMPVLDKDIVVGSVLIYRVEFERLTLAYQNYFRVITNLISSALSKAYAYSAAVENEQYIPGTHVHRSASFDELMISKMVLRKNHKIHYTVLKIELNGMSIKSASDAIGSVIRDTDFMGIDNNSDFYLVLGNTNIQEAEIVIGRLNKLLLGAEIVTMEDQDD